MTIETVPAAIVEIGAEITGIVSAIDPPPVNMDTADLPLLMCWAGRATDAESLLGDFAFTETRAYRVQVAVSPRGQKTEAEIETLVRGLLPKVKDVYRSRPNLASETYKNGVPWLQSCRVTGDSGIIALPEYEGKFIGFEIYLEVTEHVEKHLSDYD